MSNAESIGFSPAPAGTSAPGEPGVATYFAPAGRESAEEIRRQAEAVEEASLVKEVLDAMPGMVMVLNQHRQIVAANRALLGLLDSAIGEVVGKRPGEAVRCIRWAQGPDGCGTAEHCATCGAVQAILQCQTEQKKVVRECRILAGTPRGVDALDLRVTVTPIRVVDHRFLVAAVEDISQAKRLSVLERAFFHDVLNAAGCIRGFVQLLHSDGRQDSEVCQQIAELTDQMIGAIQSQQELLQAESGELTIQPTAVHVPAALHQLRLQYRNQPLAAGRSIVLGDVWEGVVVTDAKLLQRVLGNMLKNALEATPPQGRITLGCEERPEGLKFSVHNPGVIPHEIQLQIFQRSFSTKGQVGRGIGTYSIRLLGERYLQGKVGFTSQASYGTIFTLTIPPQIV